MFEPIASGQAADPGTPAWWDARYRDGETPWDTGIVPPEVRRLIETGEVPIGWALDLGCGSGVSTCYLARNGFRAIGVDVARRPLARARRTADSEGVPAYFCLGDGVALDFLHVGATLALDVGCFHSVPPDRRSNYVHSLARRLLPGATYLLYAFTSMGADVEAGPGLSPRAVADFVPWFAIGWTQHGWDRERPSAWFMMRRTQTQA